jgi:hypothetical protein
VFQQWKEVQIKRSVDSIARLKQQITENQKHIEDLKALTSIERAEILGFYHGVSHLAETEHHNKTVRYYLAQIETIEGDTFSIDEFSNIWQVIEKETK